MAKTKKTSLKDQGLSLLWVPVDEKEKQIIRLATALSKKANMKEFVKDLVLRESKKIVDRHS